MTTCLMFRLSLLAHFSPGATIDNDSRLSINLGEFVINTTTRIMTLIKRGKPRKPFMLLYIFFSNMHERYFGLS